MFRASGHAHLREIPVVVTGFPGNHTELQGRWVLHKPIDPEHRTIHLQKVLPGARAIGGLLFGVQPRMVYLSNCIAVSTRVSEVARRVLMVSKGWTEYIRGDILPRRRDPARTSLTSKTATPRHRASSRASCWRRRGWEAGAHFHCAGVDARRRRLRVVLLVARLSRAGSSRHNRHAAGHHSEPETRKCVSS